MRKKIRQYAVVTCCSLSMMLSLVGCGKKAESTTEAQIAIIQDDEVPLDSGKEEVKEDKKEDKKDDKKEDKKDDNKQEEKPGNNNQSGVPGNNQNVKPGNNQSGTPGNNAGNSNSNNNGVANGNQANNKPANNNKPENNKPNNDKHEEVTTEAPATEAPTTEETNTPELPGVDVDTSANITQYEGYDLVWHDEFSGTALNTADWNYELHDPGWVNAELQSYVASDENIYVQDGRLVIKPIKTGEGDNATYTSGRINTQNKQDFTYGRFEARAKVPEGKGYLPAFWMMPTNENLYGQWPRCGEIDIMEVHGSDVNTSYGTIHYGNPHAQSQGSKYSAVDYANNYHTYAVDWEPGKITWYIDGVKFYEASDWYSTTEGQGTITYPAPFDQPFYIIFNLAIGGSWVGYPDETTTFDDQAFEVDYVRVYQKTEGYDDSNVERPEKEVSYREADATGNYILNGSFATADDLTGANAWQFMTALGGKATAEIVGNSAFGAGVQAIKFVTEDAGTVDYSVQFVQAGVPLEQGNKYQLSFDAYADSNRTMIVDFSGPDFNYVRYLNDTKVALTTKPQTYTYEFSMTAASDANARLEFNLGNTSPIADVYITNIRLEKIGSFDIDNSKKVLTDGNFIYNGMFQEGTNRLGFWNVEKASGVIGNYYVTDINDGRRFLATTAGCSSPADLKLVQTEVPLSTNMNYAFSFDAEYVPGINTKNEIKAYINGEAYTFTLAESKQTYSCNLSIGDTVASTDFVLETGVNGQLYVDNIRLIEDSMIKNGSFSAGLAGYEPYIDGSASATYVVDSLNEDNAFDITINDTGDQDWKIQLKQNNVKLEKDHWYRLTFKAKSSMDRKLMYAIQRDGSVDDNWQPYTPQDKAQHIVNLTDDYQTVSIDFQMKYDTDVKAILSISMGAVGGTRITTPHRICIDDITLEEIAPSEDVPAFPTVDANVNMLQDLTFTNIAENGIWNETIANWGGDYITEATRSTSGTTITYDIKNPGTEDWHVQLKQGGLPIEEGEDYLISFKVTSSASRTMKCALMSTEYAWYAGADIPLTAGKEATVEIPFTMTHANDANAYLNFSLGKFPDEDTPASVVTLKDLSIIKVGEGAPSKEPEDTDNTETDADVAGNMLKDFSTIGTAGGWTETIANWGGDYKADATHTVDASQPKKVTYNIAHPGTEDWHVQLKQEGLALEEGETYRVTMYMTSDVTRHIISGVLDASYSPYGGNEYTLLEAGKKTEVSYEFTMNKSDDNANLFISMGALNGVDNPASTITIENASLVKVEKEPEGISDAVVYAPVEGNMLGSFSTINAGGWTETIANWGGAYTADAKRTVDANQPKKVTYEIANPGTEDWHVQLKQEGLALEDGATYRVTMYMTSDVTRHIISGVLDANYAPYGGNEYALLEAGKRTKVTYEFTMNNADDNANFFISMGALNGVDNPASTIVIENPSLVKIADGPTDEADIANLDLAAFVEQTDAIPAYDGETVENEADVISDEEDIVVPEEDKVYDDLQVPAEEQEDEDDQQPVDIIEPEENTEEPVTE